MGKGQDTNQIQTPFDSQGTSQRASDDVQMSQKPTGDKEKEVIAEAPLEPEKFPIAERRAEISPEVEPFIERIEKEDYQLKGPVTDQYGQILISPAAPQQPKIVLPLDDTGIQQGLKQSIVNSIRWLTEWCLRIIKMFPGRTVYQKAAGT